MTDEAKRAAWRDEVLAWAVRAGESMVNADGWTLCGVGSDQCRAVYEVDPEESMGAVWGQQVEPLPVVGDPRRPEAFDRAARLVTARARELVPLARARVAVYVGRVLVFAWAVAPGGRAEVLCLHEGMLRADVAASGGGAGDAPEGGKA